MRVDFKLYLITDNKLSAGVEDALKAGVKAVQLRDKELSTKELLALSYKIRELTMQYNAKLFINDRLDIAMSVDADGVHLGQASMPVHAIKKVVGERLMIGVSTHNLQEAKIAQEEGADFITLGPLYPTPLKLKYGKPIGLGAIKEVVKNISVPVFGIGGIKPENAKAVMNAGAYGVAVISGILCESDINTATEKYLEILAV
ncbi:MAG: thiamine phosphate synthase [Thermodesulfovibrionales bacterium]|nr:thiamine phosphate synthase [Thermodesulfovibrionales bacterium]